MNNDMKSFFWGGVDNDLLRLIGAELWDDLDVVKRQIVNICFKQPDPASSNKIH